MVAVCCQVVHSTVQLTYALIFGTFGPMLQSVFNLAVLYQREFQLCQSVLCTIAGALTRLFGSAWDMSLESILAPGIPPRERSLHVVMRSWCDGAVLLACAGMREFFLRTSATSNKSFQRIEVAVCFVWSCLLQSAQRNYVSQSLVDSWASIPNGLWGEGRTSAVPGLMKNAASTLMNTRPNAAIGAVRGQRIVLPSCWFPFRFLTR